MGAPKRTSTTSRKAVVRSFISATTMIAVAAIAVVTSVPANALLSAEDLASGQLGVVQPRETQTLTSAGAGAAAEVISRDAYSVSDPAENALQNKWDGGVGTFTNDPNGAIQWPFAVGVPISSGFGYRPEQPAGAKPFHSGLDFNPGVGAPIQAIADGVVKTVIESDSGFGVHVFIEHNVGGQKITSLYAHMQFGSVPLVEGQTVSAGDRVGLVGSTGQVTGPHLHFELQPDGGEQIDPYAWLKANAG
ncbi:hypothetical protein L3i23_01490 [Herbiconiux sp. L3-i23]|nr:hypothetical protein L3i23_01490 [Herbiconiux sp. L3-i23]